MGNTAKVYEKTLCDIWESQDFEHMLETISGEEVEVLDIGVSNDTSGPDYKNARIRIGNLTYVGDIEIDTDYVNWKSHGHNIDNKYNKVVLHACLINKNQQPHVYTKDGRKVPTVCLQEFIKDQLVEKIEKHVPPPPQESFSKLRCSSSNDTVEHAIKLDLINDLGMERFKKKSLRVYHRLKELKFLKTEGIKEPVVKYELTPKFEITEYSHEDYQEKELWQQLLYEFLFEALGYSKNKAIMMQLAMSADVGFVKKLGMDSDLLNNIESSLFNISGLMPESAKIADLPKSEYLQHLVNKWDKIKEIYDGETYNDSQWHYQKLRPQNFPTIRIAGGSRLLKKIVHDDLIAILVKKFTEIRSLSVLINSVRSLFVIKSDGYWHDNYVFDKPANSEIKYFIGASRADEIVINVILPFMEIYFEIFGREELAKKVLKIYGMYTQRGDNRIVRDVADGLGLQDDLSKTIVSQGMIELFRSYCSKNRCLECTIGKTVFN